MLLLFLAINGASANGMDLTVEFYPDGATEVKVRQDYIASLPPTVKMRDEDGREGIHSAALVPTKFEFTRDAAKVTATRDQMAAEFGVAAVNLLTDDFRNRVDSALAVSRLVGNAHSEQADEIVYKVSKGGDPYFMVSAPQAPRSLIDLRRAVVCAGDSFFIDERRPGRDALYAFGSDSPFWQTAEFADLRGLLAACKRLNTP